jgi:hypothetical protein
MEAECVMSSASPNRKNSRQAASENAWEFLQRRKWDLVIVLLIVVVAVYLYGFLYLNSAGYDLSSLSLFGGI